METIVFTQLDNVEQRMIRLIDSITTQNPSVEALEDLLDADANLSRSLEVLSTHQQNLQKIGSLRKQISDLETTYISLSRLVEATKTEVANAKPSVEAFSSITTSIGTTAPTTTTATDASKSQSTTVPVSLDDLLSFGKGIAKFSIPPAALGNLFLPPEKPGSPTVAQGAEPVNGVSNNTTTAATTNGNPQDSTTAAAPSTPAPNTQPPTDGPDPTTTAPPAPVGHFAMSALTDEQKIWLDHVSRNMFFPWPNDLQIKGGSLAKIRTWTVDDCVRAVQINKTPGGGVAVTPGDKSAATTATASAETQDRTASGGGRDGGNGPAGQGDGANGGNAYLPHQTIPLAQNLPVNEFADDMFDLYDPDM